MLFIFRIKQTNKVNDLFINRLSLVLLLILNFSKVEAQLLENIGNDFKLNDSTATINLVQQSILKADSVTAQFQTRVDSMKSEMQVEVAKLELLRLSAQKKLDSLSRLKLPTNLITQKIDSIDHAWKQRVDVYKEKLEGFKNAATSKLNVIELPGELQKPLTELKTSIQEYSVPGMDISLPEKLKSLKLPQIRDISIPSLTKKLELGGEWSTYTNKLREVNQLAGKAGQYAKNAGDVVNGNLTEVKNIDKALESKVSGMVEFEQLTEGKQVFSKVNNMVSDSAAMMNMAKEQLLNAAQDHFAGKEVLLQQAMDKMTKLKGRYSEVQSMADLPKRLPNPLKGKPLIERLVPGISFQIQTSKYTLLDINPMMLYKISPRIWTGLGWNHRLPFEEFSFRKGQRVYGPRASVEVKWAKGVSFKLSPELMNTAIPAYVAAVRGITDPSYREWVPGLFVGIKKDFKVFKSVIGNTEMLYNLVDPDNSSPYADRFSIRFGFEWNMKKRLKP